MSYRLFTTYFGSKNSARRDELDLCLKINASAFDSMHVISDDTSWPPHTPLHCEWLKCEERPTFASLMAYASLCDQHDIAVIANSDIQILCTDLANMDGESLHPESVLALTRWDITTNGIKLFDINGGGRSSQDVWAFRGPPKSNIGGDYFFGLPGVDNKFAHELDAAGYKVLNPSKTIQTFHLHLSGYRPGNKPENRVPGPYLFVSPHELGEEPKYTRPTRISKRASQFQA